MKIENKDILLKCARRAINQVGVSQAECAGIEDAYFYIGTAIHWIVDCLDRIPDAIFKKEHIKLISAIRCANNCLKHNVTFKEAHKLAGLDFPYDYPYDYGTWYAWAPLDNVELNEKLRNQKRNYDTLLVGNSVLSTLNELYDIVKEYFEYL